MMVWRENLHPRDEIGRFRDVSDLIGPMGVFDRTAAQVVAQHHARMIEEYEANWERQFNYFQPLQKAGKLTPELDAEWDRDIARRKDIEGQLPPAYHKGLRPQQNGTWGDPERPATNIAYDEQGLRLPMAAVLGQERIGDHPERWERRAYQRPRGHLAEMHEVDPDKDSPLSGGLWMKPGGGRHPGGFPRLYNDYGIEVGERSIREMAGLPDTVRSRRHRESQGPSMRAELRAEFLTNRIGYSFSRAYERSSADVESARFTDPLSPVSRRRLAKGKRKRKQQVTWIQRVIAQMEDGDRG